MNEITNRKRDRWSRLGLKRYLKARGGIETMAEDAESVIGDFLADLMHLADRDKIDFEYCLRLAYLHYASEIQEKINEIIN